MLVSGDTLPTQMLSWIILDLRVQDHNIVTALCKSKIEHRRCWKTSSNIEWDKSFVDDLNKELGIVRMRVVFVPRSTEIKPSFWRFVTTNFQNFFLMSASGEKSVGYFFRGRVPGKTKVI